MANYNRDISRRRDTEDSSIAIAYVHIDPIPSSMLGVDRGLNQAGEGGDSAA